MDLHHCIVHTLWVSTSSCDLFGLYVCLYRPLPFYIYQSFTDISKHLIVLLYLTGGLVTLCFDIN